MNLRPSSIPFAAGLAVGIALCLAVGVWKRGERVAGAAAAGKGRALPALSAATPGRRLGDDAGTVGKRLRGILAIADPLDRTRALLAYLERLEPGDFALNVAACRRLGLPATAEEYELLFTAWAKADLHGALAFAGEDRVAVRTVLNVWSASDPEAAHEWVLANHAGDDPNPLLGIVIPAIAQGDGARAMGLIAGLPREDRWYVFHQMVPRLIRQGEAGVRAWLETVPEKLRGEAVSQIANEMAPANPAGAVAWLQQYPDAARTANVAGIFRALLEADREGAMRTFDDLPAGRLRQEALRGLVVQEIFRGDATAALVKMDGAAADVDDSMLEVWAAKAMAAAPAAALEEVLRMQDLELRDASYRKALRHWLRADEAAAQGWLRDHGLPAAAAAAYAGP
ncbi:MAG: hypothetical protein JWO82_398 [Akkermansiaceae bacterium]|nr:hypothetical protein [Akkermansiaceae bacterium]